MSRKMLMPPATLDLGKFWARLNGVDRCAAIRERTAKQWRDTLSRASCVERRGKYDQIGQAVISGKMANWALEANRPTMALPRGSWRAKGLKARGCTGGLFGLGIRIIQLSLNQFGMMGWIPTNQCHKKSYSGRAMNGAKAFHTGLGAHGRATALTAGMALRAFSSSSAVNGRPVKGGVVTGNCDGPCQVS